MVKIPHSLHFITEVDETHPIGMRLLQLDETAQVLLLESMLKDLLVPALASTIEDINKNGSYAILKVAE
jgi:hypothetical protein